MILRLQKIVQAQPLLVAFFRALWFVLLLLAVWTLRMPLVFDLAMFAILFFLFVGRTTFEIFLCSLSIWIAISVVQLSLFLFVSEGVVFYREHEKWALLEGKYVSNVDDTITIPHGDLLAINPNLPQEMAEPRIVHFKTDNLGYRNSLNYHGQVNILLGDSFVVGNGIDQSDTIAGQLATKYGLDTYSLAFVDSPGGYEQRALEFLQMKMPKNPDLKFSMFIYEGNDFVALQKPKPSLTLISGWLQQAQINYNLVRSRILPQVLPRLNYSTLFFNLVSRSLTSKWFLDQANGKVSIYKIGQKQVGFFDPQTDFALSPGLSIQLELLNDVWSRVKCVFFVPSKARVYKEFLPIQLSSKFTEPAAGLNVLRSRLGGRPLRIIDLTPDLQAAAANYLQDGKYVFWTDDTHWNGLGVNSISQTVFNCMTND